MQGRSDKHRQATLVVLFYFTLLPLFIYGIGAVSHLTRLSFLFYSHCSIAADETVDSARHA